MLRIVFALLISTSIGLDSAAAQDDLPQPQSKDQDPTASTDGDLRTAKQQKSYAVGYEFGTNLHAGEADLDPRAIAKGVVDGLLAKKPPFTDEQIGKLLSAFEQEMGARQDARMKKAAGHNRKTAGRFLADNSKRHGVQTTKSGLQYRVLKSGKGQKPTTNDVVRVHYEGTHIDGSVFDSSIARGEPAEFGVGQVITGWTEALQLMRVGDKWQVVIPPELGYGEKGTPGGPIGPNEVLVFEVELLGIVSQ